MKRSLYILLFFVLVSFNNTDLVLGHKSILITPKSELHINGTSNVTDFKCRYNIKNLNRPIRIQYKKENKSIKFENSQLVLENSGFDCGGRGINRDFHGLLQSDIYPQITLKLKEITLNPQSKHKAMAWVEIEIAGIKESYQMETEFSHGQDWLISGKLKLNIKDFELKAPKKMLGLIVVSDEIEINFNLVVQEC